MFRAVPSPVYGGQRTVGVNMAGTRTVPEFANRIFPIRVSCFPVWARLVAIRMAAGTVGLERRVPPDDDLGVGLMALGARQIATMVERLERCGRVPEVVGRPGICIVATVAFLRSAKVAGVLAGRDDAVVAGRAGAQHLRVINREYG